MLKVWNLLKISGFFLLYLSLSKICDRIVADSVKEVDMYKLGDKFVDNCGSKAKLLSMLKSRGYNVPLGIVIDFEEFKNIIKTQNLNIENINEIEIPDELINRIFDVICDMWNHLNSFSKIFAFSLFC